MIRQLKINDIDILMDIWFNANINAHNFIDKNYWVNNFDYVKTLLPQATIYVYQLNNNIVGFVGLNNHHIECIFIKEQINENTNEIEFVLN